MNRFVAPLLAVMVAATAFPALGDTYRLASWNIANFWHIEGEHLRPAQGGGPGLKRTKADYDAIKAVIADLNADVYALEEIGSPESAAFLFPPAEWTVLFEERFSDDLAKDPEKLKHDDRRDIYTALAVRKGKATVVARERLELDVVGADGRSTREGTAALLDFNGLQVWVAALHMKSGCNSENNLAASSNDACKVLAKQIPVLEVWVDQKSASGKLVLLLGDFNRKLDRSNDDVRADLFDNDPVQLFKVPHRQQPPCTVFGAPTISIDYAIANAALWPHIKAPEVPKYDISDDKLSDHCPVYVDLVAP